MGEKQPYVLSMKDLCADESIGELIDAGITSFKIEGRMKRPVDTAGVVSVYRRRIDQYLENGKNARYRRKNIAFCSIFITAEAFQMVIIISTTALK